MLGNRASDALLLAALAAPLSWLFLQIRDNLVSTQLIQTAILSFVCFGATVIAVPQLSSYLHRRGLKGKDFGRRGTPSENEEIPSALGLVCGVIYLVFVIVTQLWAAKDQLNELANYSSALLSITFMVLLGFADDTLDLPWRYKLLLPTVAALPLLATYRGVRDILVPDIFRPLIVRADGDLGLVGYIVELLGATVDRAAEGAIIDLGYWYLLYMLLLAVFATNAINIYAGINGLEAGQSGVIGVAVLTANIYELAHGAGPSSPHLFSARIIMPFIATTLGVLWHNVHPAQVFVGDTFCYFAGMTLACAAILGHFSKTLLLFLLPQIVNFIYSTPQLFKMYPCPRHRLPHFDASINALRPSTFKVKDKSGILVEKDNMTLINVVLRLTGPLHERSTTSLLLWIQALTCGVGLLLRFGLGPGLASPAGSHKHAGSLV